MHEKWTFEYACPACLDYDVSITVESVGGEMDTVITTTVGTCPRCGELDEDEKAVLLEWATEDIVAARLERDWPHEPVDDE